MNMNDAPQIAASAEQHERRGDGSSLLQRNDACICECGSSTPGDTMPSWLPLPTSRSTAPSGLTDWELDRIQELLERSPNDFELAVFSLLWSEHCGYKHSAQAPEAAAEPGRTGAARARRERRRDRPRRRIAVAFKAESHNHPSAVEPFQGAATGVGGILRDIIAMGARPIALLDGLRFGGRTGTSGAPSPGSATTATASASRRSAASASSTRRTRRTRS